MTLESNNSVYKVMHSIKSRGAQNILDFILRAVIGSNRVMVKILRVDDEGWKLNRIKHELNINNVCAKFDLRLKWRVLWG